MKFKLVLARIGVKMEIVLMMNKEATRTRVKMFNKSLLNKLKKNLTTNKKWYQKKVKVNIT